MALSRERTRELARHFARARLAVPQAHVQVDTRADKQAVDITHAVLQRRRDKQRRVTRVQRISGVG